MEKETVKKFDLEAAFKALDEIETPKAEKGLKANRVDFKEALSAKTFGDALIEDYYNVNDATALEEAKEDREAEIAKAKLARIEKIVDLDAKTEDDLLPSYVGKTIIQCPQCMTLFYKNPEDIETSDENPDVVNINEVCQHCGNASGYTVIGKVDAVTEEETAKHEADEGHDEEENELDLTFEAPTEEVSPENTGGGFEDEEVVEEGSDDSSDDSSDEAEIEQAGLEVEESVNRAQLNENELTDAANFEAKQEERAADKEEKMTEDDKKAEEGNLESAEKCEPIDDSCVKVTKTVEICGKPEEVEKLTKCMYSENKSCGCQIDGANTSETAEAEDTNDDEAKLDEELTPREIEQRLANYAASLKVDDGLTEEKVNEGAYDVSDAEFKAMLKDKTFKEFGERLEETVVSPAAVSKAIKEISDIGAENETPEEDSLEKDANNDSTEAEPIEEAKACEKDDRECDKKHELIDFGKDLEDLHEDSLNKHISDYLTEVYSNVKDFKATECTINGSRLTIEGLINFASGNAKTTTFVFTEAAADDKGNIILEGCNKDFSEDAHFTINCVLEDGGKYLVTESFGYKYKINDYLVEGLR